MIVTTLVICSSEPPQGGGYITVRGKGAEGEGEVIRAKGFAGRALYCDGTPQHLAAVAGGWRGLPRG